MNESFLARDVGARCPSCGRLFRADLVVVADTRFDPSLGEVARSGELNRLVCPECGGRFSAEVPVLFHDPAAARAVAYVPGAARQRADEVVAELLGRLLAATPDEEPGDYLLEPQVVSQRAAFTVALGQATIPRPSAYDHPHLDEACAWALRDGQEDVLEVLEVMLGVGTQEELILALNARPSLLRPETMAALSMSAQRAERDGEIEVAEVLLDIAALLHLNTPTGREDDSPPGKSDENAGSPGITFDAEGRPSRARDDAWRATDALTEPGQREGFQEHALLFGSIVEQMLRPDDEPSSGFPDLVVPESVPLEALHELLAAPSHDLAADVIDRYPALISPQVAHILRQIGSHAANEEDDALVSHLEMLIGELQVAGLTEEEADREDLADSEIEP